VIYGVSDNSTGWWDNGNAERIGFTARDSADTQRTRVEAQCPPLDPGDPAALYQGGAFVRAGPFD
jgi:uronate dehydrogenase